jgi:hypothetical protein
MANDIITNLDDEAVQGLTLNQAVEKMRGPVNTKIKLKIIRKGRDKPLEITLTRDNIRVRSVRARVESDDIAYIRITTFNEQTTEGLKREMANLTNQIGRTRSRVTSSTCATIRAACLRKPCRSPTHSSIAAKSSPPAAAMPRKPSGAPPSPAISPRASR